MFKGVRFAFLHNPIAEKLLLIHMATKFGIPNTPNFKSADGSDDEGYLKFSTEDVPHDTHIVLHIVYRQSREIYRIISRCQCLSS